MPERKKITTSITIDPGVLQEVARVAGKRRRSAFFESAARAALAPGGEVEALRARVEMLEAALRETRDRAQGALEGAEEN